MTDIHNIPQELYTSLKKCCNLHDIGKVVDDFQLNIESTYRKIRHEILSASYKELSIEERISILLHHKPLKDLIRYIDNVYYNDSLQEMRGKLDIEVINIMDILKQITRYNRRNLKLLHEQNLILMLGYLKLCDRIASAGIKNIDIGFNAKNIYNFTNYKSIQRKVLNIKKPTDIIIKAPTGIGKTETSLFWSDMVQNNTNSKRIFYLLPYTASINALYKRFKDVNISVGVLHSKVKSLLNKDEDIDDIQEELQLYQKGIKQVTICTIFQLIKAIFSCKNFEMILAQLKDSIIIVDEIHCFDIKNFTLLIETLKFLKQNYGVHICIMSASIPNCILHKISQKLNINTIITADKEDYLIRHHINLIDNTIYNNLDMIRNNIKENKKILICVNRVDTCQNIYTLLHKEYPDKKIKLIHGKFNARDRTLIEQNIKDCDVLIGTQAIEVSLDIDYDIMYTEIAPFDSLIQRFGRVNRKGLKKISEIYIFNQYKYSIYDDKIINSTYEVLEKIVLEDKGIIFENKITTYLNQVYLSFSEDIYNNISISFNNIINNIAIGYYNKNVMENLIDTDTINVLPVSLLGEYYLYIKNKKYIEANELFVQSYNDKNTYYDEDLHIFISNYIYDDRGLTKELK